MGKYFVNFFIASVLVYLGFYLFDKPTIIPRIELNTKSYQGKSDVDSCESKDRCIVVYLTPWCGVCKTAMPAIQQIRKYVNAADRVGMKIIVGKDNNENLDQLAKEISGKVYLDYDEQFYNQAKIRGVPTWWVIDDKRKILITYPGFVQGATIKEQADVMIDQVLKLSDYL
jgi:thiol-disulfide isomerase/thioredoxin